MGRLMDSIMAAVGLKPSDRVTISTLDATSKQPSATPSVTSDPPLPKSNNSDVKIENSDSMNSPNIPKAEISAPSGEEASPEAEPSQKDCLSCRLVGGAAGIGTGTYIGWITYKRSLNMPSGVRRKAFIGQGALLGAVMFVLGAGRLLNIGLFDPNKAELSYTDHMHEDLSSLKKLFVNEKSDISNELTLKNDK